MDVPAALQHLLHDLRRALQLPHKALGLRVVEDTSAVRHTRHDQIKYRKLCRIRLGTCHRDLRSRIGVEHIVALSCNGGTLDVDDRKTLCPTVLRILQRL